MGLTGVIFCDKLSHSVTIGLLMKFKEVVMVTATVLFWIGVVASPVVLVSAMVGRDVKNGGLGFPFMMLVAAAVAKYLGI